MEPSLKLPASLEDARIKKLPLNAYYIADFITVEEERMILEKIQNAPKPRWKMLTHRRLQTWPSELTRNNTLLDSPLPGWLVEPVITRLLSTPVSPESSSNIFSDSPHGLPNHVLINEYQAGEGIMPHKDGSAYYPVVCTVSLGSSLPLEIYGTKDDGTREEEPKYRILQEPRSLLITTGELYTEYLHGIAETTEDINLDSSTVANWDLLRSQESPVNGTSRRTTRTSLTYRDVVKVSQIGAKLGLFGRR